MRYNRHMELVKNPTKLARYRAACLIFRDLGVDIILLEHGKSQDVVSKEGPIVDLCALEHMRTVGYQECLDNLFALDEQILSDQEIPKADFGALRRMIDEGTISEDDARQISDGDFE